MLTANLGTSNICMIMAKLKFIMLTNVFIKLVISYTIPDLKMNDFVLGHRLFSLNTCLFSLFKVEHACRKWLNKYEIHKVTTTTI